MELSDIIEPNALKGLTPQDSVEIAAQLSVAISLKRIADALSPSEGSQLTIIEAINHLIQQGR